MIHKLTGELLDTNQGLEAAKWIFVMSPSKKLYAGKKKKGLFHHSSFLAGGATLAAGRFTTESGMLKSVWAYSGHYRPTDKNFGSFLALLEENGVNLDEVQVLSPTEDSESYSISNKVRGRISTGIPVNTQLPKLQASSEIEKRQLFEPPKFAQMERKGSYKRTLSTTLQNPRTGVPKREILQRIKSKKEATSYQLGNQLSSKWTTGAGPRIGCVADYPLNLRVQALEFVDLSPKDLLTQLSSPLPVDLT